MIIEANGLRLAVDDAGGSGTPVLLIMGLGGQLIHWPQAFVQGLQDAGYRPIRFDNRDAGLSSHLSAQRPPPIPWLALQTWLGRRPRVPYTLHDMAGDARAVLDALGIERAHVVGLSMGAMIAQRLALRAPERLLSLTSIMGSSGSRRGTAPSPDVARIMLAKGRVRGDEALMRYYLRFLTAISSRAFPPTEAQMREVFARSAARHLQPDASTARQLAAIVADAHRAAELPRLRVPTLVVHGADDPLVPLAGGRDTARRIPGARFEVIADMAHDLAPIGHPEIVRRVLAVLLPFLQSQSPSTA